MYRQTSDAAEQRKYLSKAIEHYDRRLYLFLKVTVSDRLLALEAPTQTGFTSKAEKVTCRFSFQRAHVQGFIRINPLAGRSVHAEDVEKARELAEQIKAEEGPAAWRLESTFPDLERSSELATDKGVEKQALNQVIGELKRLVR